MRASACAPRDALAWNARTRSSALSSALSSRALWPDGWFAHIASTQPAPTATERAQAASSDGTSPTTGMGISPLRVWPAALSHQGTSTSAAWLGAAGRVDLIVIGEPPKGPEVRYCSGSTWRTAVGMSLAQSRMACQRPGRYQWSAVASVTSNTSLRPDGSANLSGMCSAPARSRTSTSFMCGDNAHRLTERKVPARIRIASNSATALPHAVMTGDASATRATSRPRSRAGRVTIVSRRASAVASTVASTSTSDGPGRHIRLNGENIRPVVIALDMLLDARRPTAVAAIDRLSETGNPVCLSIIVR